MKKITLLSIMLCAFCAQAQITYESADYATAGQSYTLSTAPIAAAALLDFSETGPNHTWDFSSLSASSQADFSYMNPNNAGYKISWCFANGYLFNCNSQFNSNFNLAALATAGLEVQNYGITNVIEHSKLSATALETKMVGMTVGLGSLAAPVAVDYTSPDVVYQFPMVYGDTYNSNGAFNIDFSSAGFPITYSATIGRTNTVEGWGSLTTPMGTFANVLKVKTVLNREDEISIQGIGIPIPTTTVSYKWFDKDFGIPVLQADGTEIGGVFIPLNVSYMDEEQCLEPLANFAMLPFGSDYDPATQSATVGFANISTNFDSVVWDFGDGGTSSDENPTHTFSCPGMQDVTLTITNSICTPVLTNTITIPVEITDSQNAFTTAISVSGNVLTADRTLVGTSYSWFDCINNTPIAGANEQSLTVNESGSYACELTTNGCVSMSDCITVDILQNADFSQQALTLLPNPTSGKLELSGGAVLTKVEIYNLLGEKVGDELDLTGKPSGIYLVRFATVDGEFVEKVVKN